MNICIIIPSFNLVDKLKKCLDAVIKTGYKKLHIVIVDNGSTPPLKNLLVSYQKKFKNLSFIRNGSNIGFAQSMNMGLNYAKKNFEKSDYFLLLNNDAYLKKNFFSESLAFLKKRRPDLMSPIVLLTNNRGVDTMGIDYYSDGTAFDRTITKKEAFLLAAACLFISKNFLSQCFKLFGWFFIPNFESFAEDTELSLRARLMNKKLELYPYPLVYHDRASTIKNQYTTLYLGIRNQIWTIITT